MAVTYLRGVRKRRLFASITQSRTYPNWVAGASPPPLYKSVKNVGQEMEYRPLPDCRHIPPQPVHNPLLNRAGDLGSLTNNIKLNEQIMFCEFKSKELFRYCTTAPQDDIGNERRCRYIGGNYDLTLEETWKGPAAAPEVAEWWLEGAEGAEVEALVKGIPDVKNFVANLCKAPQEIVEEGPRK
ncbi:hypothetical protein B0H13DRAFT_1922289 [Mycena leptocephala]|nr:hypothetical protein B0H13DRAFT_1922289 [Mycena leptocephala]